MILDQSSFFEREEEDFLALEWLEDDDGGISSDSVEESESWANS